MSSLRKKRLFKVRIAVVFLAVITAVTARGLMMVTPQEMAEQNRWVQQNLLTSSNLPPFSFIYAGQPSSVLLPSWVRTETDRVLDSNRTQHVLTWTTKGLQVKCVAVEYKDYPVVEWTVWFKHIGTNNTPILQDIQGLDTTLSRTNGPEFILNGLKGDFCAADSFEPYQITLGPNVTKHFGPPESGKSCDGPKGWPYYNLQKPGGGIILAIGWPGQWASSFSCDAANHLRIQAGQQLTHLFLEPGEQIRTPLILMLFWRGTNVVRAQNIWRHFYLAHIIPRVDGRPPSAMEQIQVSGTAADTNYVEEYLRDGIRPNLCWRDAQGLPSTETGGATTWYVHGTNGPYTGNNSWLLTGTWEVNTNEYPYGFRPFVNWIHAHGMKFVLWFEPERVGDPDSWLELHHPKWLLPGTTSTVGDIFNEGNPAAFQWLTNHFERLIKSNGVDWYREDMNGGGPLPAWRNHDPMDREGITENFYVQGHLAYWDALLAMNPGFRIDCCGSGGRRDDLEAMRRAVPLLRSDFQWPGMSNLVDGNQCQTYGLSFWLPFQGTGCYLYDPYSFRSFYLPCFGMGTLTPGNATAQRQAYSECKKVGPIMLFGNYYPLTRYSLANNVWMAWQFDWPKEYKGVVQAFRRSSCNQVARTFHLRGLDPAASYKVTNFDKKGSTMMSGKTLMGHGLTVQIRSKPGAAVVVYERQQ